jgi:hypothetical protein
MHNKARKAKMEEPHSVPILLYRPGVIKGNKAANIDRRRTLAAMADAVKCWYVSIRYPTTAMNTRSIPRPNGTPAAIGII